MTAAPLAAYPGACDCHMHVYEDRWPLAPTATFKPPHAPAADYLACRRAMGSQRAVVVQPTGYGFDNRCTLEATAALGPETRAVVVVAQDESEAELARLHGAGRAQRPLHDAAGRRAALVGARPDRGADRAARLARRPAARRPRAAAARGGAARAAVPAGGRPRRPLPRPRPRPKARPSPRSAACSTPAAAGSRSRRRTRARSSARQPTPTSRRWRGRWPSAIPSGACGPATGRIRTSCRARPTRRWSTGRSTASPASRRGAGSWSTTRPSSTASERRRPAGHCDDVEAHQHLGRQALADAEEQALVEPRPARVAGLERDLAAEVDLRRIDRLAAQQSRR